MAFAKHTLIIILIFAFLLLLTQCSKAESDDDTSSPAPAPAEDDSSPTPTPSPSEEEKEDDDDNDDDNDDDDEDEDDGDNSSPTPSPNPTLSSGPAADSPLSMSELLELSLPEIGVQKIVTAPLPEGAKVSNKQLEGIEHKIVEFKTTLAKRDSNPGSEGSQKCLTQCQDNLDDAIDGVKKGIESINKQDLSKANIDISGVATDIETCNDCFIESDGEDKEVNAFNDWIKGVTKECLSNLKQT